MPDTPADPAAAYLAGAKERWGTADSMTYHDYATALEHLGAALRSLADVPRLAAAVEAVLARHQRSAEPVVTRHLCGPHAAMGFPGRAASREKVDACPDCVKTAKHVCVTCRHECPDNDEWPCAEYQAITTALTGGTGGDRS